MLFAFSPPPSPSSSLLSPPPNVSEFVQRRKKKRNNKNERNKKKEDKNKQKNAFFSVTHYFHGRTVDSPWVMGFFCTFFFCFVDSFSSSSPPPPPSIHTYTHSLSLVLFLFSTFFVFKAGVSVLLAVTLRLDESVFTFLLCVPVRHICLCLFSLYFIGFGVFPRLFLFSFSLFSESSPRL